MNPKNLLLPTFVGLGLQAAFAQNLSSHQQAVQDAVRQQQRQSEQDRALVIPRSTATVLPVAEVPAPSVSNLAGGCRQIGSIRVTGVSLLPADRVADLTASFEKRCLSAEDITMLMGELTRLYLQQGWVMARVYLPTQPIADDQLRLQVIEGKVAAVRVEDGGAHSINPAMVAPFTVGQPLNMRDFEQALDQINRLASNDATIDMLAGDAPGDTVVLLRNQPRKRWQAQFSLDNQGSESTGRHQAGVTLSHDNPFGLNDFTSLNLRQTVPNKRGERGSESANFSYVLPFGYQTLSLNLGGSRYAIPIASPSGATFYNRGNSENGGLRLDRVLFRDAGNRLAANLALNHKRTRSYLEGTLLDAASRKLTVLDTGISADTTLAGGSLSLEAGYSRGLTALGARRDTDNLTDQDPHAQFQKWTIGGSYRKSIELAGLSLQYSGQWSGQYAQQMLYGSEQFSIGSLYSVRGFDKQSLSGEHGFYWRNEIATRLPFDLAGVRGSLRPWLGLDRGVVRSRGQDVPQGWLSGMAAGLQLQLVNGVNLEVIATRPLSGPAFEKLEGTTVWTRLSAAL